MKNIVKSIIFYICYQMENLYGSQCRCLISLDFALGPFQQFFTQLLVSKIWPIYIKKSLSCTCLLRHGSTLNKVIFQETSYFQFYCFLLRRAQSWYRGSTADVYSSSALDSTFGVPKSHCLTWFFNSLLDLCNWSLCVKKGRDSGRTKGNANAKSS